MKLLGLGGRSRLLHYERWLVREKLDPQALPGELAQPSAQARTCASELTGDFSRCNVESPQTRQKRKLVLMPPVVRARMC
eukprot:6604282-Lingulodinium_polyedra.AAC.1